MNPCVELDVLSAGASYTVGVPPPPGSGYTFPPLAAIFPRVDCHDLPALDWAVRATLRVKTWSCTLSYDSYVATTVSRPDGSAVRVTYATGPSGTRAQDYTAAAGQASDGTPLTKLDEAKLLSCFQGGYGASASTAPAPIGGGVVYLRAGSTADPDYCRTVILTDAVPVTAQGLHYVFTLDAQLTFVGLPVGDGTTAQVFVQTTGTATPAPTLLETVIPFGFDGQSFNGLTAANAQPKDFESTYPPGPNLKTTTATTYRATQLAITAKEYWTYGGKFDPDSGALT